MSDRIEGDKVRVACPTCMVCRKGTPEGVLVDREDYERYRKGEHIQNAFPYLSADVRETMMTGTHGKCFDDLFGEED